MRLISQLVLLLTLPLIAVYAEVAVPETINIVGAQRARSGSLPPYVVYRHFLAWVNQLDKDTKDSRSNNPYKFAEKFSCANLRHQQLDVLRDAAQRQDADLRRHEARAQLVISRYRREAKRLLAQGEPLPPPPPEIRILERERTALLIQQDVSLWAALGSDASGQLDRYLGYEFAPHIKLRRLAAPAAPAQPHWKINSENRQFQSPLIKLEINLRRLGVSRCMGLC